MTDTSIDRFLRQRLARRRLLALGGVAGAALALSACGLRGDGGQPSDASQARPEGWQDDSHGKDAAPNYDVVFPADRVNTLKITVSPESWTAMLANMTELYGERGTGSTPQADGGGQQPAPGLNPGQGPGPGWVGDAERENPIWVPGTIEFNGRTWTSAGVRFKGNSSLMSSWREGTDKLPFKLDFDQFESDFPEVTDQRFYGFKQLALANNFGDESYIRETLAYDIFEAAGLVAANTASYTVLLDHGDGEQELGLYTVVEVIDDTVIERAFADATGAIYEADGRAASLADGTYSQIEASFQVEGGDNANWDDVRALYDAVHSEIRTTDAAAWRKQLEARFDVEPYLSWLGLAAAMQHWDTYGAMTHNYYLYNDPGAGKLSWVSWDHNLVLGASGGGGGGFQREPVDRGNGGMLPGAEPPAQGDDGPPARPDGGNFGFPGGGAGGPMGGGTALDRSDVTDEWPLIRFVLDQPEYMARYNEYLRANVDGVFEADALASRTESLAAVVRPHVPADSLETFDAAITSLVATIRERNQAVRDYLATL